MHPSDYGSGNQVKVNWGKSSLRPAGEVSNMERLAEVLCCEVVSLPILYIGLPLGAKSSSSAIWDPVFEKTSRKFSWKGKRLSNGGKLVMIKSVMASVPINFFSIFQAPKIVINRLERMQRDFLWGSSKNHKKIH